MLGALWEHMGHVLHYNVHIVAMDGPEGLPTCSVKVQDRALRASLADPHPRPRKAIVLASRH